LLEVLHQPLAHRNLAQTGLRSWLKLDKTGRPEHVLANKHRLTDELGLQSRDLRLLDPAKSTSYPSAILCRDRALLVNLEQIRCIITTQYVLVLDANKDAGLHFVEELQQRLFARPALTTSKSDPDLAKLVQSAEKSAQESRASVATEQAPFELRVLEVVLDLVCEQLLEMATELERAATPILKSPTAKTVTTLLLDKMRRIKNRLTRLKTRAVTVREVLEKFLEDDTDMKQMNLTAREEQEMLPDLAGDSPHSAWDSVNENVSRMRNFLARKSMKALQADSDDSDVAEVEMVLEAYFMHIDNTFNKLQTMSEYIDDTEEFIDLEIDNFRNNLIRTRMTLNAAALCVAVCFALDNVWGMNLDDELQTSYLAYVLVAILGSVVSLALFVVFIAWCMWMRLLPRFINV
jgi:magnesium transporter